MHAVRLPASEELERTVIRRAVNGLWKPRMQCFVWHGNEMLQEEQIRRVSDNARASSRSPHRANTGEITGSASRWATHAMHSWTLLRRSPV